MGILRQVFVFANIAISKKINTYNQNIYIGSKRKLYIKILLICSTFVCCHSMWGSITNLRYSHRQSLTTQNQLSGFNCTFRPWKHNVHSGVSFRVVLNNNGHVFLVVIWTTIAYIPGLKTRLINLGSKLILNLIF